MTIIPLHFKIQRAPNGKKEYIDLKTNEVSTSFKLKWEDIPKGQNKITPSYAIRPDDDLLVIDCDSLEATQAVDDVTPHNPEQYIVVSDKGEKHYYYEPTEYYQASPLYRTTRLGKLGKIDVLHGKALVFAPCPLNTTKLVFQGSLDKLTPIPDSVVDYLVSLMHDIAITTTSDYSPVVSFMGHHLSTQLSVYARSKNYLDLQSIIQMVTPMKFRKETEPDGHPDRIADGDGTEYIQAITAKIGRDPSISLEDAIELLTIITQELWSSPLSSDRLQGHIDSIPTQRYPDGKPVFVYDANAMAKPMVSINSFPYMPVYRTLDDNYIIAREAGGVEVIKGLGNFKKAMATPNYSLLVNGVEVKTQSFMGKAAESLATVTISELAHKPVGQYIENNSLYYNIYQPTKFLGIIRGEYLQELSYIEGSTPIIDSIIANICRDHPVESLMEYKLTQFIAHKLKTLQYTPIVFQIRGNRGTGKSLFINILNYITGSIALLNLRANNSQFNADAAGKMWLIEEEGIVTRDIVNTIKTLSGNEIMRVEAKGKDAIQVKNIGTLISTSNYPTPLAETRNDRRFVTISSFTSQDIGQKDIAIKIALELEQWCLMLRDTKLSNPALYTDANAWHDNIHYDAFEAKGEHSQDNGTKLAHLMYKLDDTDGEMLKAGLEDVFGQGMHYKLGKGSILMVYLWQSKKTIRNDDGSTIPHQITKYDLEKAGLGMHVKEDKNFSTYNTRINYLKLELSQQQAKAFNDITIQPLEE